MKKYCIIITLLLLGCQPPDDNLPSNNPFSIEGSTVVLHKSHIISVKTELYQPSFELQGIILPKTQKNLVASSDGVVAKVSVSKNSWVKKDKPLLTIRPSIPIMEDNKNTQKETIDNNIDTKNTTPNSDNTSAAPDKSDTPTLPDIVINAPLSGVVKEIYTKEGSDVKQGTSLLVIHDESSFFVTSTLPLDYQKHLNIGQNVQFTLKKHPKQQGFSGQIAKLTPKDGKLTVLIQILPNPDNRPQQGMQVGGRIDYGDLEVGVLVPKHAIYDGISLNELDAPPHKPATPMPAHIWVIRQDATLSLSPVHIVAYQPDTQRYLVSGISQDSLIVTAKLPKTAHGKSVVID